MKQKFKRIGSMLLVLAMLLSLFPGITPKAYAAGTLNTIPGLTATWTDASDNRGSASWSANGTSITGTATGYTPRLVPYNVTTTLTLTNNSGSESTLSFDYTLTGGGSVSGITGGSYSGVLADGASLTITLKSPSGVKTNTLSITALSLISTSAGDVTTTFKPAVGGSYTVNSEEITAKTSKTDAAGTEYTVRARAFPENPGSLTDQHISCAVPFCIIRIFQPVQVNGDNTQPGFFLIGRLGTAYHPQPASRQSPFPDTRVSTQSEYPAAFRHPEPVPRFLPDFLLFSGGMKPALSSPRPQPASVHPASWPWRPRK